MTLNPSNREHWPSKQSVTKNDYDVMNCLKNNNGSLLCEESKYERERRLSNCLKIMIPVIVKK